MPTHDLAEFLANITEKAVATAEARWRIVVALGSMATLVAAVFVIDRFAINTDNEDMLSAELPFRQKAVELKQAFPALSDNVLIVVDGAPADVSRAGNRLRRAFECAPDVFGSVYDPAGDPFFRRNGLLYLDAVDLDRVSRRLIEAQPLLAALNASPNLTRLADILGGLVEARAKGDIGTDPVPFIEAIAATVETAAAGTAKPMDWRVLMSGDAPRETARRIIVLKPPLDYSSLNPAADVQQAINKIVEGSDIRSFDVDVRITGGPILEGEELATVRDGLGIAGLLSCIVVGVVLTFGLRSLRRTLALVLTLAAGLVLTAAYALAVVGPFNLISVAFAVLFVGLGVDFGIHVVVRRTAQGAAGVAAIAGPLALCMASTTMGFLAFLITDYDGLAALGLVAAGGMVIALGLSLSLLPALLTAFGDDGEGGLAQSAGPGDARMFGGSPSPRAAGGIIAGALVVALIASLAARHATFDFDPLNLRDASRPAMATFNDLVASGDVTGHGISVVATNGVDAGALAARLSALPEVAEARTLDDFVPDNQDDKLWAIDDLALAIAPSLVVPATEPETSSGDGAAAMADLSDTLRTHARPDEEAYHRLADAIDDWQASGGDADRLEALLLDGFPTEIERLRQALEADTVAAADLPQSLTERYRTSDGRYRIEVTAAADTRDLDALRTFVRAVRGVAPDATGPGVIVAAAGHAVVDAFVTASLVAGGAVALILLAWFRRVVPAAACFVPLILAGLITAAATVWLGVPFNFANVIVLPLLFGIGVDFAIHVVSEIEHPTGHLALTHRAIVLSALTTIGSFGGIALSGHPGTSSMGILLTVALSATLVMTVLVTPALLVLLRRRRNARHA